MGRRSDQVSFEAKRLRVCVECNVCRLSSRNLDRVVCGAPSEDVENMPADQGETMIGALSKCKGKGKHGAQRASVRAHAGNQQFNFSGMSRDLENSLSISSTFPRIRHVKCLTFSPLQR